MRKYSYPYLFIVTVSSLGAIFLFYWWKVTIYRATFLYPLTSKYLMLISLAVSLLITLFLVGNGIMKKSPFQTYLKLFGGISIAMVLFSVIMVMAITWFIPGVPSSYTATYVYATGSSKSCSGADVDDPDLGTNIRICYPEGNYEYNNTIYVEKRSNLLGAVVTYARTTPSRF